MFSPNSCISRLLLFFFFLCLPSLSFSPQTICDAYPDPNLADKGGAPYVRYGRLVEEVEGVFGVRELERHPECDVNASVKAAQVRPAGGDVSSTV